MTGLRRRGSHRWVWIAVLLTLLGGGLVTSPGSFGLATVERTYTGSVNGDDASSVSVQTAIKAGRNRAAVFQARGVEVVCEDGVRERLIFDPLRARFVGPRRFEARARNLPQDDGARFLLKVEGRVRHGRAQGVLFYYRDDYDPPAGPDEFAECSTDGLLRWRAMRE